MADLRRASPLDRKISRRAALRSAGAVGGGLALSALLPGVRSVAAQQSVAELSRVAEDVYFWNSQFYNSIFIVTDAGVIVGDPIGQSNPRSPQMFEAAIAAVTDQPVKYVVYSHDHGDHAMGGSRCWAGRQLVRDDRLRACRSGAQVRNLG